MMKFEDMIEQQGGLCYTNTGDSMMPLLKEHDTILIISRKPQERLRRLDVPLYKRDNGQYILHRVIWVREEGYVMCGDNQWHPETGIEDRHIIGILDSIVRNGVTIPVRSTPEHPHVPLWYVLYVHLWCDFFFLRAPLVWIKFKFLTGKRKLLGN